MIGNFCNFGNFFLLINNCFGLLKIMGIVGKFQNCGIISNLLICEFLKIFWNIFGNFIVENKLYWIIEIVGIVRIIGKF